MEAFEEKQPIDIVISKTGMRRVKITLSIDSLASEEFKSFDNYFAMRTFLGSHYKIDFIEGKFIADAVVTRKQAVELKKKPYVTTLTPYGNDVAPLPARERLFTHYL